MTWTCPTCKVQVAMPFCPACGEHPLREGDLSLRQLLRQLVVVFTNFDAKVLRTLRTLIMEPGVLTRAFYEGQRKPYLGGFQIFILANVLFFTVQSFSHTPIFSNPLAIQIGNQPLSDWGRIMLDMRLKETGHTYDQYEPLFNQAIATNAKSLVGLMVPFLALGPLILFWNKRRPYAVHVIFALHYFAFLLLMISVPLLGTVIHAAFGGSGLIEGVPDKVFASSLLVLSGVYIYFAIGLVYEARGTWRIAQAIVLAVTAAYIFFGYRFVLVPITLYTT